MPQVPVYGGAQVRSNALQPVQQREIDVSSGLRAAGQALTQLGDLGDKFVRREAETEANRIDSEITSGWLMWDAENRRKYQGQNADQYGVDAEKWWNDAREKYGANLSPLVQSAVGTTLGRKKAQALASVAGHIGTEKERFADQVYDAAQNTDIEYAVDIGDFAGATGKIKARAAELGKRKGWTTEQVIEEQQKRLGALHLTAITVMSERDPAGASKYLEANKGEIPQQAQVRARGLIDAELENQRAKARAAKNAGKPLAEQLADGADLPPSEREKYNTEVRNNHAMVKAARVETQTAAKDEAWGYLNQGKRVPESVWMRMDQEDAGRLREHLADRARQAADRAEGKAPKTDWNAYIDAREKLAAGEKVDLRLLTTKIAPAQLEQLLDIQTKSKDPGKRPEVATSEQQLSAFTRTLDLKGERIGQFQSAAYDRFNMHLKAKGKEPTYDERQTILDQLTLEVVTDKGFFFDSKAPAYAAPKAVRDTALPLATVPVKVATRAEALALKPGTKFIDPQGVERTR
jgi:hypothetical protein